MTTKSKEPKPINRDQLVCDLVDQGWELETAIVMAHADLIKNPDMEYGEHAAKEVA